MVNLYVHLLAFVANVADRVRHDDEGATAVEYGLMVSLIAIFIIGAVSGVGQALFAKFQDVATNLH